MTRPEATPLPDLPDMGKYSIRRAIRTLMGDSTGNSLEREVHDALQQRNHRSVGGILIPWAAEIRQPMDTTGGLAPGASALNLGQALIDRTVLGQMGAMIQIGLQTSIKLGGATTVQLAAVAEDGALTDSLIGTEAADLDPVTVGGQFRLTRRLWLSANVIMDQWVNFHLMTALRSAVDGFGVLGSGAELIGIHPAAVGVVAPATWAGLTTLENTVLGARALDMDTTRHGFVIDSTDWKTLRDIAQTTGGQAVIAQGPLPGTHAIAGYPAWPITGPVGTTPTGVRLFGNFNRAWVGIWGNLEVVDVQTTTVASGQRHFNAMVDMNAHPIQKSAFAKAS